MSEFEFSQGWQYVVRICPRRKNIGNENDKTDCGTSDKKSPGLQSRRPKLYTNLTRVIHILRIEHVPHPVISSEYLREEYADRAIRLDLNNEEAFAIRRHIASFLDKDFPSAIVFLTKRRALIRILVAFRCCAQ
jgi:hypothetical protein